MVSYGHIIKEMIQVRFSVPTPIELATKLVVQYDDKSYTTLNIQPLL